MPGKALPLGLPKLLVSDHVRRSIEETFPPFPLDQITNERERERAMTLLSYLGHAYVWRGRATRRGLAKGTGDSVARGCR